MKKFSIDTNFNFFGPYFPALSLDEVRKLKLTEGEKVVVSQDSDEWKGVVFYDKALPQIYQWFVELQLEN